MTKRTCDTCGKEADTLTELMDRYRVKDVVEVCEKCEKEINGVLMKIIKAQRIQRNNMIRQFIQWLNEKYRDTNID